MPRGLWGGILQALPFLKHTQICESCKLKASEQLACRGHICLAILVLFECPSALSLTSRRSCMSCFPFLLPVPVSGLALRMIKWLCGWPHPVVCVPGEGSGAGVTRNNRRGSGSVCGEGGARRRQSLGESHLVGGWGALGSSESFATSVTEQSALGIEGPSDVSIRTRARVPHHHPQCLARARQRAGQSTENKYRKHSGPFSGWTFLSLDKMVKHEGSPLL